MEEYKIRLIKEKYGVDLRSIDFNNLDVGERLQWGKKILDLEQRLMIDRLAEMIKSPTFDSIRAYKREEVHS